MSWQRAKGTGFETAVVNWLLEYGYHVERTGSRDYSAGDIVGLPDFLIECKNHKTIDLAGFMDQTIRASERTQQYPLLVVKRRLKNVKDSYAVMPLWAFEERVLRSV